MLFNAYGNRILSPQFLARHIFQPVIGIACSKLVSARVRIGVKPEITFGAYIIVHIGISSIFGDPLHDIFDIACR